MRRCLAALFLALSVAAVVAAAEDVVAPGDNMVAEGLPPIPAALAEGLARYTEIREAYFASWHPVRREMLITTRFAEADQAHLVQAPGGARTQLTFGKEPVGFASFQPTHGEYFIFSRDVGGNENHQYYRQDLASGNVTLLTDGESRHTGGAWSNRGDRLAYHSTQRNGQDNDLWVMDPAAAGSGRLLAELSGGGWQVLDWSPDDRQLVLIEGISVNESYLWLVDAATGAKTLVTPKGGPEKVAYGGAEFSADGKSLFVTTDRGGEFQRLARLDLATGEHTYLTSSVPWDVEAFDLSWDGRTIACLTNEGGASVLRLLDARTGKEKPAPALPPCVAGGLAWHRNDRDLAVAFETARSTSDAYVIDTRARKVERWTFSETGGINTAEFPQPELVRWDSFDGRAISGFLYRPPARFAGKRPVILNIHGGPEGQARPIFLTTGNYYLNELGVAILYPNIRGSTGFGKTFATLDNGLRREDSYRDIEALLDWIARQPDLDPDRVMIMGGSYGGHMVLAIATYYPERFRCAVDVVGISNLATFLENTAEYRRDLRRVEYGDERDPQMREFMQRTAPLNNAAKIKRPLFIVQGGNDPRVPLSEAEQMLKIVREHGTPVWYLMAKDEGHGFAKKSNSDFLRYAIVAFMQEFLLK